MSSTASIGIVGLTNSGKSSFFSNLTGLKVLAENYPFCTIDPNQARVQIPDARYEQLVDLWNPSSRIPSYHNLVDPAGLVQGASEGCGLGNAFLSHITGSSCLIHVVRAFDDPSVIHVEGTVDPVRDLNTVKQEMIARDLNICNQRIEFCKNRLKKANAMENSDELAVLCKVQLSLADNIMVKDINWAESDVEILMQNQFLTANPVVYVINLSPEDYISKESHWFAPVKSWIEANGGGEIVNFSCLFESQASLQPPEARDSFFKARNTESGIPHVFQAIRQTLDTINFFTAGQDEVRCWTLRRSTKAPKAAGLIHTLFETGFVRAEVIRFDDFLEHKTEAAVREAGKVRMEGKEYEVQDGDIIGFRFIM